tara:strand:- start:3069 stop:3284 length:216 start_codon:yes stop_codon:yes gene_type:complete
MNVKLTTGETSRMVALVPDYDGDGYIDYYVLPKNNFVSDSVTDEINFFMIDGCETSGIVGNLSVFVKWEVL